MRIGRLRLFPSQCCFPSPPQSLHKHRTIPPAQAAAATVDDQRLHAAKSDGDWITFGRDYSNQRFVPFREINRGNASRLAPAWTYPLGTVGTTQTHPLVVGGVMYGSMAGKDSFRSMGH